MWRGQSLQKIKTVLIRQGEDRVIGCSVCVWGLTDVYYKRKWGHTLRFSTVITTDWARNTGSRQEYRTWNKTYVIASSY
jgi:hypothetical protein